MARGDPASDRGFTVENTPVTKSPARKLLTESVADLPDVEVAGIILGLVRDCAAITPSPSEATIVINETGDLYLHFVHKILRVLLLCDGTDPLTWSDLRFRLSVRSVSSECLIVTTRDLTDRARSEIDDPDCWLHYIELSHKVI